MLTIGHINFINVIPVDVELIDSKYRAQKVLGVPSILNKELLNGCVDVGFFSSVFYLRNRDSLEIPAPFGIVSKDKAMSVILASRVSLEGLRGRKVNLYETPASETSIFMNQVILKEYFKIDYTITSRDEAEAELLIGDEALTVNFSNSFPYIYDIGTYWKRLTGYPAVFAVLCTRKNLQPEKRRELDRYIEDLKRTLELTRSNSEIVVDIASRKIRLPEAYLEEYFNSLYYELGEEEFASLAKLEEFLKNESRF
jgi:chorismate dehydratase